MEIEELEDINFNDLVNIDSDEDNEEFVDIFKLYSTPYFMTSTFNYLFRLSVEDKTILLDEIKVSVNSDQLDEEEDGEVNEETIVQTKNVCKLDADKAFNLINHRIDIRDLKTELVYNGEPLCFEINNKDELDPLLVKNKLIVLSELYIDLLDQ